jgi:MFS family permease
MPEPAKRRGSSGLSPRKLIAYSVAGLLVSGGLCGLSDLQPGWLLATGRALFGICLFTLPFGIIWAIAEAVVNAVSKKKR